MAAAIWSKVRSDYDAAERIGDEELMRRPDAHNDLEDAMRHAEWNRRMASEINPAMAFAAGWGHELANLIRDGQPLSEIFMDLNNNREGRQAGSEGRAVNAESLVTNVDSTRSNAGQYATNNPQYADPREADLAAGKPVTVGPTKIEYNKDTGTATLTSEYTGSRIRTKVEVKVEIETK